MFLARLGHGSKCGHHRRRDTGGSAAAQTFLAPAEAHRALHGTEGIAIVEFSKRDVVRHPLVQRIIAAYEQHRGRAKTE